MPNRRIRAVLLSCLLGFPLWGSAAIVTNVFYTGFERSEGYDPYFELVGQKSWLRYPAAFGGNGLITNFPSSPQVAYIGLFPLQPLTNSLSVYRHVDYTPPTGVRSTVNFSIKMDIEDSTDANGKYDLFCWMLYNSWGDPLFSLEFNNKNWDISYGLENAQTAVSTGARFTNGVLYQLLVSMDFQSNRWSAVLSNQSKVVMLATNLPITTTNTPLNFGSMDLIWIPEDPRKPGDNFLIFDDYTVTATLEDQSPARLLVLGAPSGNSFPIRLYGPEAERFAIEVSATLSSWTPLTTNTISGGFFDYVDQNPGGTSPRFFRARRVP